MFRDSALVCHAVPLALYVNLCLSTLPCLLLRSLSFSGEVTLVPDHLAVKQWSSLLYPVSSPNVSLLYSLSKVVFRAAEVVALS
jgi:hypothetical protein